MIFSETTDSWASTSGPYANWHALEVPPWNQSPQALSFDANFPPNPQRYTSPSSLSGEADYEIASSFQPGGATWRSRTAR